MLTELLAQGRDQAPSPVRLLLGLQTEAQRVLDRIRRVGELEHEADQLQEALSRRLFVIEDGLKPGALYLWIEIIRRLGSVANRAEKAANRLRMFLAT